MRKELLDELLKDYKKPDDLTGENGIININEKKYNDSNSGPVISLERQCRRL